MQWLNRVGVIGIFICSVGFTNATAQQWGGADRAAVVITQSVGFERIQRQVEAVGYAEAQRSVALYPAVSDLVLEVNFKPGQQVKQGDVLVRLDDRQQQVNLQRARIQLEDAERTVKRLTTSRQQGAIAQSELDAAITARDLMKVAVREAEVAYEDRQVRAPFDGVVGITDVEPGDRITTQTLITTIDQREQLYIDFNAPEAAIELLMKGGELHVTPWTARTQRIPAEIIEVDSRINMENRTIRVRAAIDNSQDMYRPGMSFRVGLTYYGDNYVVVPESALMWSSDGAYIWLAKEGKAQRVNINIQQRLAGRILVEGPIQLGDTLITEGIQSLRDGQLIRDIGSETP